MEVPKKEIPKILTLVDREKFRRKLAIASRILAIFLILAIVWVGYIQVKYVKEINMYRSEYGPKWSCYVCGIETGRSCSCNYVPDLVQKHETFEREEWFKNIAEENVIPCEVKESELNFSITGMYDIEVVE